MIYRNHTIYRELTAYSRTEINADGTLGEPTGFVQSDGPEWYVIEDVQGKAVESVTSLEAAKRYIDWLLDGSDT